MSSPPILYFITQSYQPLFRKHHTSFCVSVPPPPPPQSAIKQEPGFADATQASRALKYAPIITSPIAAARVHTLFPEGAGATTSLLVSLLPPDHSHSRLQG